SRDLFHCQFGEDAGHRGIKLLRASPDLRPGGSATFADAIVDAVILLLNLAIERSRSRRLRNARPRDSLAGRRQVVLVENLPRLRLAELRSEKTVVLPISPNARGRRNQEGGDDCRFRHDPTL